MRRLLMIPVLAVFAGCGDNFDRDELINGPQDGAATADADQTDADQQSDTVPPVDNDTVSPACGNGTTDTGETCDGDAKDCAQIDAGFTGGLAECRPDCSGYDISACQGTADLDTVQPDNTLPDDAVTIPNSVTVTVTTSSYGGEFAPRNVFAIWLEAVDGAYIHSMGVWAQTYKSRLSRWYQKSGGGSSGMADAVTGASRYSHGTQTVSLDFTKYPVAAGGYKVWFELNETNGGSRTTSADITLGPGGTVTGAANTANIKDIAISFTP